MGPIGVASKLKGSLKCSQADMYGARVDWRIRFKVGSVCGRIWSHSKFWKESETLARMKRKWDLRVCMARSAMFQR